MHYRRIDFSRAPFASAHLSYLYDLINLSDTESIYCCLPKGTICITITLRGVYELFLHGRWVPQPRATVFGLITERQFVRMSADYREITIGFHPHRFQAFTRIDLAALAGAVATPLADLFELSSVDQLYTSLALASDDTALLGAVEQFLAREFDASRQDARLAAAYRLVKQHQVYNVSEMSAALNVTTSGLRNLFRRGVGFTPKQLIRLARIERALTHPLASEGPLTELAYELGYYDQSHFIHEFERSMGLTPKEYFKNPALTNDFYNYSRLRLGSFAEGLVEL